MIGLDSRGAVGVQLRACKGGRVSVDDLVHILGDENLVQRFLVLVDDSGVVHEFSQTRNVPVAHRPLHVKCVHDRAGILQRCGRNTAGDHVPDGEFGLLRCPDHIVESLQAINVYDLMRICNDCRRAAGDDHASELFGRSIGRLNVNVRVDQAG